MTVYKLIILSSQEHFSATINWIHVILLGLPLWNQSYSSSTFVSLAIHIKDTWDFFGISRRVAGGVRSCTCLQVSLCWGACKLKKKHLEGSCLDVCRRVEFALRILLHYMFRLLTHDFLNESILLHYMFQIRFHLLHCTAFCRSTLAILGLVNEQHMQQLPVPSLHPSSTSSSSHGANTAW